MKNYQESQLYKIRHSLSHVLAQAVLEMFPGAKLAIGPATDDGFYYDFDLPRNLVEDDLPKIEKRMSEIVKAGHKFIRRELTLAEARELYKEQPYKLELINDLATEHGDGLTLTTYKHDTFEDLCRGPHVESLAEVNRKAFKLTKFAGAYWRGDEKRKQLQRIYGTAFETVEAMDAYFKMLEEAEKRDHRKLGKELDLFSLNSDLVGGGLVLWHPNGALMRHLIESFWKEKHLENGYQLVNTPHIGRANLWKTSGHLGFYKDSMYSPIDIEGQEYFLKPMNCPFHIMIYNANLHSYKELPIRFAEMGTVYRFERSGTLHGMSRVRGFTQDDAHHIVEPEKMPEEIDFLIDFSIDMLKAFGLSSFKAYLSTRPSGDGAVGEESRWRDAENALEAALKRKGIDYDIDAGGGSFYGPKIDIKFFDAIGREWQLSTIQFDFNLPERFDMVYVGEDGKQHRPYMIHRALLGSLERFFSIFIEHHGGNFPVWLCPVQARVLSISEKQEEYARSVVKELKAQGLRAEADISSERLGNKIRLAQGQKIPYVLVVGDKEVEAGKVAVRQRGGIDLGPKTISEFMEIVRAQ